MTSSLSQSALFSLESRRTRGRLFIPIVFLLTVLLIDVTLYTNAEEQLSLLLSSRIDVDMALLTAVFPLFSFNIALVILIVLPYLLMQARYYYPIEVTRDADLDSGTFLHVLEKALTVAFIKATQGIRSLFSSQQSHVVHSSGITDCAPSIRHFIADMNAVVLAQPELTHVPARTDVVTLIVEVLQVVQPLIECRQQVISFQPPEENDVHCIVDRALIAHVLHVLIANSCHLAEFGSTLALSVKALPEVVTISMMDITGRHASGTEGNDPENDLEISPESERRFSFSMTSVREIVKASRGQFWFADNDDKRVRWFVELPRVMKS